MVKFIMLRQARRGLYGDVMRTVCIARAQGKGICSSVYKKVILVKHSQKYVMSGCNNVEMIF